MLADDIYTTLQATFSGRVYPDEPPEGVTIPFAIYQRIGGADLSNMTGRVAGTVNPHYQVDVFAVSRRACTTLVLAVKAAMDASVLFKAIPESEIESIDEETGYYRSMLGYSIWQ